MREWLTSGQTTKSHSDPMRVESSEPKVHFDEILIDNMSQGFHKLLLLLLFTLMLPVPFPVSVRKSVRQAIQSLRNFWKGEFKCKLRYAIWYGSAADCGYNQATRTVEKHEREALAYPRCNWPEHIILITIFVFSYKNVLEMNLNEWIYLRAFVVVSSSLFE